MSGLITTGSAPKALWPGVSAWYGVSYNNYPKLYDKMFDEVTSKKAFEELVAFVGMGLFKLKPEGKGIQYDDIKQGAVTRVYNKTYALGYMITEEMIEDNQYPSELNVLGKDAGRTLGENAAKSIETLAADFYNRAFDTDYTFGDGSCLCTTSHAEAKGLTFSNTLATPADLSEVSLETALTQIRRYKNAAGLIINMMGQSLIVPPEQKYEALRILQSAGQNDSANNALNALKTSGAFPKGVIENPYLTDAKNWFIRTDLTEGKGLVCFMRRAPEVKPDNDFETGSAKFKCTFRISFTNGDPRSIFGVEGP